MKQGPLKRPDMAAEVIKVERPGAGDISREYGPYINEISLYFCQYNRGKKGIAIDMRSEEGKKVVMDLVAQGDFGQSPPGSGGRGGRELQGRHAGKAGHWL